MKHNTSVGTPISITGKLLLAAGLTLLLGGFAGCGNSPNSVDYQAYCSKLQECSGGVFPFQSVDQCAQANRTAVEAVSGECQNTTVDLLKCETNSGLCEDPNACESERDAQGSACSGEVL